MPTLETLREDLEWAKNTLGSDAPIVKTLQQQLDAYEGSTGQSAQQMYLSQGLPNPKPARRQ